MVTFIQYDHVQDDVITRIEKLTKVNRNVWKVDIF